MKQNDRKKNRQRDDEEPRKKLWENAVVSVEGDIVKIGERDFRLVTNHREGFDAEKIAERYSDILQRYDYIVGDWGFEQLRLKGFFDTETKKGERHQKIDTLQDYLNEYCNFGCAYFVLEQVGGVRELPKEWAEENKPKQKAKPRKKWQNNHRNKKQQAFVDEKVYEVKKKKSSHNSASSPVKGNKNKSNQTKVVGKKPQHAFVIRQKEGVKK
ncbi:MAG: YutD family protein [Streptococcaceae bacterium]|jgi:uncharacterized protein YutD|nr:YutD family protein [Streptococcaceae bacterium]